MSTIYDHVAQRGQSQPSALHIASLAPRTGFVSLRCAATRSYTSCPTNQPNTSGSEAPSTATFHHELPAQTNHSDRDTTSERGVPGYLRNNAKLVRATGVGVRVWWFSGPHGFAGGWSGWSRERGPCLCLPHISMQCETDAVGAYRLAYCVHILLPYHARFEEWSVRCSRCDFHAGRPGRRLAVFGKVAILNFDCATSSSTSE